MAHPVSFAHSTPMWESCTPGFRSELLVQDGRATASVWGLWACARALRKRCARHCDLAGGAGQGVDMLHLALRSGVGSSPAAPDPWEVSPFPTDRKPIKQPHPPHPCKLAFQRACILEHKLAPFHSLIKNKAFFLAVTTSPENTPPGKGSPSSLRGGEDETQEVSPTQP